MNQNDLTESVIPGLTRNPVVHRWIPAFAGMTWLSLFVNLTDYYVVVECSALRRFHQHVEQFLAVAFGLGLADAGNLEQVFL